MIDVTSLSESTYTFILRVQIVLIIIFILRLGRIALYIIKKRDMIESCIAVGEAALEIPHSEENELIMKGQMMAYDQVLGLIDSLISK